MFTQARKIKEIFREWNHDQRIAALAALGFVKAESSIPQSRVDGRKRRKVAEARELADVSGENLDFLLEYKASLPLRVFNNLVVSILSQIYNQDLNGVLKIKDLDPNLTEAEKQYAARIKSCHDALKPMLEIAAPAEKCEDTKQDGLRNYRDRNLLNIPRVNAATHVYASHNPMREIFRGLLEKHKVPVEQAAGSYPVYIIHGLDEPGMVDKIRAASVEFFQAFHLRNINGAMERFSEKADTNLMVSALFETIKKDPRQSLALFSHICSLLPLNIAVDIEGNNYASTELKQSAILIFGDKINSVAATIKNLPPEFQMMAVADIAGKLGIPQEKYKLSPEKKTFTRNLEEQFETMRWL
jgi:hypothetical protein